MSFLTFLLNFEKTLQKNCWNYLREVKNKIKTRHPEKKFKSNQKDNIRYVEERRYNNIHSSATVKLELFRVGRFATVGFIRTVKSSTLSSVVLQSCSKRMQINPDMRSNSPNEHLSGLKVVSGLIKVSLPPAANSGSSSIFVNGIQ